jgi:hypothetical protein
MKVLGRRHGSGRGGTRPALPRRWIVILVVAILVVLLLLSRGRQRARSAEPEETHDKEESMGRQQTPPVSEDRENLPVNDEESGLLASRWFWRGIWAIIAGLMALLIYYEFAVLG